MSLDIDILTFNQILGKLIIFLNDIHVQNVINIVMVNMLIFLTNARRYTLLTLPSIFGPLGSCGKLTSKLQINTF